MGLPAHAASGRIDVEQLERCSKVEISNGKWTLMVIAQRALFYQRARRGRRIIYLKVRAALAESASAHLARHRANLGARTSYFIRAIHANHESLSRSLPLCIR